MRKFIYDRATNAVRCGYELNRIALFLHIFMWFLYGHELITVLGIVSIIISYACVYFAESIRVFSELEHHPLAEKFTLGTLIFTSGSFVLWLISTFGV